MKCLLSTLILLHTLSSLASTGDAFYKWHKKNVIVCWQDDSDFNDSDFNPEEIKVIHERITYSPAIFNSELKTKVQELIQSEFTMEKTGITFSGWKSCQKTSKSDLVIFTGDSFRSADFATVGRMYLYDRTLMDQSKKNIVYLNLPRQKAKISALDYLLMTALHEFGHAAGLRHEHIRSSNDCSKQEVDASAKFFSVRDSSSIMNYCLSDFIREEVGLAFYRMKKYDALSYLDIKKKHDLEINRFPADKNWAYIDDSIFTKYEVPGLEGLLKFKVRIGLSKGDIHGLKCMYVYDAETSSRVCNKNFDPLKATISSPR